MQTIPWVSHGGGIVMYGAKSGGIMIPAPLEFLLFIFVMINGGFEYMSGIMGILFTSCIRIILYVFK